MLASWESKRTSTSLATTTNGSDRCSISAICSGSIPRIDCFRGFLWPNTAASTSSSGALSWLCMLQCGTSEVQWPSGSSSVFLRVPSLLALHYSQVSGTPRGSKELERGFGSPSMGELRIPCPHVWSLSQSNTMSALVRSSVVLSPMESTVV